MNSQNPTVTSYIEDINVEMKSLFLEVRQAILEAEPSFEEDIK